MSARLRRLWNNGNLSIKETVRPDYIGLKLYHWITVVHDALYDFQFFCSFSLIFSEIRKPRPLITEIYLITNLLEIGWYYACQPIVQCPYHPNCYNAGAIL
jgi:hypothetical protein